MFLLTLRIAALSLTCSLTLGCISTTIADMINIFEIQGEVVADSGEPIEGAVILFSDTTLDDWRQGRFVSVLPFQSDLSGRFFGTFEYPWGYKIRGRITNALPDLSKRGLTIIVRSQGFVDSQKTFQLGDLPPGAGGALVVDLGTVRLRPAVTGN